MMFIIHIIGKTNLATAAYEKAERIAKEQGDEELLQTIADEKQCMRNGRAS